MTIDLNTKELTTAEKATVLKFFATANGYSLAHLAELCGLSERVFSNRLTKWNWYTEEVYNIGHALKLDRTLFNALFSNSTTLKAV